MAEVKKQANVKKTDKTNTKQATTTDNTSNSANDNKISFKVDASAVGCSGMFWRNENGSTGGVDQSDWPRNGTIIKGWYTNTDKSMVKVDNGKYMPMKYHGTPVCFEVTK
mmetsp:Transcript_86588/g.106255  ORF Transcript_86588/g.106255 Transcript_86588/m.106255 type:complete len:110 (-) Transcript_86588:138-467(-)